MRTQSILSPTKLVKLKSDRIRQFFFHSRIIIKIPNLLQQFCCKLNCFDLAYLLILAQSVSSAKVLSLEKALAVLIDWVRCCYLYTLQL